MVMDSCGLVFACDIPMVIILDDGYVSPVEISCGGIVFMVM